MGKTSNEAKQRYNEAHYVQLKVSVNQKIATAFKEKCIENGVSMAGVLSQYMAIYSGTATQNPLPLIKTATRPDRRDSVKTLIGKLEQIRDAEETYRDNIPANLQSSPNFDAADESVAALADALDLLLYAF